MPAQRWSDNIWILTLTEDPDFTEDIEELQVDLIEQDDVPHVLIDLSELHAINSSNLSLLLRLRKQLIDADRQLRLVAPPDAVWAVFMSTALDKVFTFTANAAEALASLQILDE